MQKLYVVMGMADSADGKFEWPVRAFTDVAKARELVNKIDGWLADSPLGIFGMYVSRFTVAQRDAIARQNPYDANMVVELGGVRYFITETELDNS